MVEKFDNKDAKNSNFISQMEFPKKSIKRMPKMKWLGDKVFWIIFCVSGGFLLKFLSHHLDPLLNHILQGCLVIAFVMIVFWKNRSLALVMSSFTALVLGAIEIYAPSQWYNLLRAALILLLMVFLIIWARGISHK